MTITTTYGLTGAERMALPTNDVLEFARTILGKPVKAGGYPDRWSYEFLVDGYSFDGGLPATADLRLQCVWRARLSSAWTRHSRGVRFLSNPLELLCESDDGLEPWERELLRPTTSPGSRYPTVGSTVNWNGLQTWANTNTF